MFSLGRNTLTVNMVPVISKRDVSVAIVGLVKHAQNIVSFLGFITCIDFVFDANTSTSMSTSKKNQLRKLNNDLCKYYIYIHAWDINNGLHSYYIVNKYNYFLLCLAGHWAINEALDFLVL